MVNECEIKDVGTFDLMEVSQVSPQYKQHNFYNGVSALYLLVTENAS
jgi:hypothetical protein